jgi:hypothetical protein
MAQGASQIQVPSASGKQVFTYTFYLASHTGFPYIMPPADVA